MKFLYFVLFCVILIFCFYYDTDTNTITEPFSFGKSFDWRYPFWNVSSRNIPLYYDIRGDPNIVYRKMMFGDYVPYGYIFGPYIYDSQGNYIKHSDETYYIR